MTAAADLEACRAAIRTGSRSFHAASKLLPRRVRDPALALYAFCRLADDAVDEGSAKPAAVLSLRDRLDLCYAGRPRDAAADRAFANVIEVHRMPRALPEALLEGLAWDACGRRYRTLSDIYAYSARVAASVGAMMCVLMDVRDPHALARACDLGVAMQITNIARDIGEDARAGRVYVPLDWLDAAELSPEALCRDPHPDPRLRELVGRLLADARRLYQRAEAGIPLLPLGARPGILAARHIYAAIGGAVARNGHDSVTWRARTGGTEKLGLIGVALLRAGVMSAMPRAATLYARPLPETAFLVEAAAEAPAVAGWGEGRIGTLVGLFAELEARDRAMRPAGGNVAV
jgi:phytoene synthase